MHYYYEKVLVVVGLNSLQCYSFVVVKRSQPRVDTCFWSMYVLWTFYGASCFWTHTISFLIITNLTGQTCLDFVFGPFFHLHYKHLPAQFLFDTFSKLLLIMRMKWLSFSIPQHHHVHFNMVVWTMLKWTCQSCVDIVWTQKHWNWILAWHFRSI